MNIGTRVFILKDIDLEYENVCMKLLNPSMLFESDLDLLLCTDKMYEKIRTQQFYIITYKNDISCIVSQNIEFTFEDINNFIIADDKEKILKYLNTLKKINIRNLKYIIDVHQKVYEKILEKIINV